MESNILSNPNAAKMQPAIRYALIFSGISIIMMVGAHYGGLDMQALPYRLLNWAIMIGCIVWMVKDFRDTHNGGFLTVGQGVGISALTGLFLGIITAIFFALFMTYIAPEMVDQILNQAIMDMEERGLPEDQIEQGIEMTKMFISPVPMAIMVLISVEFFYTLVGLIVSLIMKRD